MPAPEEDPEGYAAYLRRKVVATARAYVLRSHTAREVGVREVKNSYPHGGPQPEGVVGLAASFRALCDAIADLDKWKEEFRLDEID